MVFQLIKMIWYTIIASLVLLHFSMLVYLDPLFFNFSSSLSQKCPCATCTCKSAALRLYFACLVVNFNSSNFLWQNSTSIYAILITPISTGIIANQLFPLLYFPNILLMTDFNVT